MSSSLTSPHCALSIRSSLCKVLLLTLLALLLVVVMFKRGHAGVRLALIKTANAVQQKAMTDYFDSNDNDYDGSMTSNHKEDIDSLWDAYSALSSPKMNCTCTLKHLSDLKSKYELGDDFEYLKRYVRILRQDIERKSITKLTQNFLDWDTSDGNTLSSLCQQECPEPLIVRVPISPFPATADASDFMFGVSTTYDRLTNQQTSPMDDWSYWLTDGKGRSNGGKLVLMLLDASDAELEKARDALSQLGVDVDVYHSDSSLEMAVRYLTLVPSMYNHTNRETKKWLVTCDDDTFFPSMHGLVQRFQEFDASRPLYIGTLSEDVEALEKHGSQAFGGGGVFLSLPLAKVITEQYEECKSEQSIEGANTGWGTQGDILLRNCIYDNTEVRLTTLWDLWQLDLYGDPSGFYESGIKPLSLHHYRGSWHVAHPFEFTKLAHLCGDDCTLQRFQTADNFVISAGFSVAQYPRGIDFDLHQFERTFAPAAPDKGWNLDFMLGPQRQSLHQTGRKWSWDMQESTVDAIDGSVTQVYIRKSDDWRWKDESGEAMGDRDGVIELVWVV